MAHGRVRLLFGLLLLLLLLLILRVLGMPFPDVLQEGSRNAGRGEWCLQVGHALFLSFSSF